MAGDLGARAGVVVVNFRSSHHVAKLLASLSQEQLAGITVWDNYSGEQEVLDIRAVCHGQSGVELIESPSNIGFGAAVNQAVERLRARCSIDWVWILNPDLVIAPGSLDILIRAADFYHCAIVSPLILNARDDTIWYSGGRLDKRRGRSIHSRMGQHFSDQDLVPFDYVDFVSGAAPLVKLDEWERVGGFDEHLFLYCEDAELSMRLSAAGMNQGVARAALARHAEGGSSGGGAAKSPTFYYYVQRNRLLVYPKQQHKLRFLLGAGFEETLRLYFNALRHVDSNTCARLLACTSGLVDGIRGRSGERQWAGRRDVTSR